MLHTLSRAEFRDRFGERDAIVGADGELLARLWITSRLVATDSAVDTRITQLTTFNRSSFARALSFERDSNTDRVTLISEYVPGVRLSEVLRHTSNHGRIPDLAAALFVVKRLLTITERARAATGVTYFAIAPERIVVTPRAELVVVEAVLAADYEARVKSGAPELGPLEDIAHIARIGLSMVLGRLITEDQYLDPLSPELGELTEVAAIRANQKFADSLRIWLEQALVTDRRLSFDDFAEARAAFDSANAPGTGYAPSRRAFRGLLAGLSLEDLRADEALTLEKARVRALRARTVEARWSSPEAQEDLLESFQDNGQPETSATSILDAVDVSGDDEESEDVPAPIVPSSQVVELAVADSVVADPPEDAEPTPHDEPAAAEHAGWLRRVFDRAREARQEARADEHSTRAIEEVTEEPVQKYETGDAGDTVDSPVPEETHEPEAEDPDTAQTGGSWIRHAFDRARHHRARVATETAAEALDAFVAGSLGTTTDEFPAETADTRSADHGVDAVPPELEQFLPDANETDDVSHVAQAAEESDEALGPTSFWNTSDSDDDAQEETPTAAAPSSSWIHDVLKDVHHEEDVSEVTSTTSDQPDAEAPTADESDENLECSTYEATEPTAFAHIAEEVDDDEEDLDASDEEDDRAVRSEPDLGWLLRGQIAEDSGVPEAQEAVPESAPAEQTPRNWLARLLRRLRKSPSLNELPVAEVSVAAGEEPGTSDIPERETAPSLKVSTRDEWTPGPLPLADRDSTPDQPTAGPEHAHRSAPTETAQKTAAAIAFAHLNKESKEPKASDFHAESLPPAAFEYLEEPTRRRRAPLVAGFLVLACLGYGVYAFRDRIPWPVVDTVTDATNGSSTDSTTAGAGPPTTGALSVTSTPPGARVNVDGRNYGVTPVTLSDLEPGRHTVLIEDGSGSVRRQVTVSAGETAQVDEAIFAGFVAVFAPFELQVFADGQQIGTTDNPRIMLPPGRHELELVNTRLGFRETRPVNIEPGETVPVNIQPAEGRLRINAPAGADVLVDGEPVGQTPLADLAVRAGTHEVLVRHPQLGERRSTAAVKPGVATEVNVPFAQ